MGANCCIVGTTEKETLQASLQWASTWAAGLARDLSIVQECLNSIGAWCCHRDALHNNYSDNISKEQLMTELDAKNTLISGLCQKLRNAYLEDENNKGSLLGNLALEFDRLRKQCEGELPIPVDGYGKGIPFDEFACRLKKEGNPLHEECIRVKIAGNEGYFRRMTGMQIYEYISNRMTEEWKLGKNKDESPVTDCHFALVFQDREAIDAIVTKTLDVYVPAPPEPYTRETISVFKYLLRTFKNIRVFFLKDSIEDFPLPELKRINNAVEEAL